VKRALLALGGLGAWAALRSINRPEYSLRGKTVLVTGGSRGLGFVLAREAAREGARVAICGRDPDSLDRARVALERVGAEIIAVPCDVTDPASVRLLVETVGAQWGQVDVLINNAGVIEVGPAETMTIEDFREALATNFWGMLYPTLEVLPAMRARGSGRIVNITSIGGKLGIPHLLPYSVSKFAAMGFSQGLRAEVATDGIKVVAVVPGLMRTGSPRNAIFRGKHRSEYAWFSIGDSLPGLSISAERAAQRILRGLKRGNAEVLFPLTSRLASVFSAAAPNLTAETLALVGRLLPRPARAQTGRRKGRDSQSAYSPSWLTRLGDRAARKYNQIAPSEEPAT
jgi:NAD(P)-dependent dehydrogenase (short-subunit alcohol dehydrogenase family)